jgi:uncharacterized protein (DUF849 family)
MHSSEVVQRLIRNGLHLGPIPFDSMELIRRARQGSSFTYQSVWRLVWPISAMCIALGQHLRAGIEDNLWDRSRGSGTPP